MGKVFVCVSLVIPWFVLLSHISSPRLSSGHSGPVLTLRTNDAAHTSLPGPSLLVAVTSIWVSSPLAVVVRRFSCGLFFFFLPVMLPSEIPKFPTDLSVRGFPAVWKLLLDNSLPRTGLLP